MTMLVGRSQATRSTFLRTTRSTRDDEDDVPHVLELAEYRMTDDAEYDSWLLLEALEADTLDAEPQAAAQDTTAMEM